MNRGCLEALESMLTNVIQLVLQADEAQGSVGLRAVWFEHDVL